MLNSSGEIGHPCLVPDLRGNPFSFSPLRIMFACCGLIIYGLYYVKVGSFYAHFWRVLIINGCWILKRLFFCICWDYHMVFIFQFSNMVYHIDWFVYTEESLHPWNKPNLTTWSWCMSFLMCFWILIAKILLRIFGSMFIGDIGL